MIPLGIFTRGSIRVPHLTILNLSFYSIQRPYRMWLTPAEKAAKKALDSKINCKYMKKMFLSVTMMAFGFCLTAQEEKLDMALIEKIKKEGLGNSQVMDIAFYLTDVN